MDKGRASVVIVNWNHKQYLYSCLVSLKQQTYHNLDIIVVDNASSDGSIDRIPVDFPDVRLYCLHANLGFSKAFNFGAQQMESEYVLSLNPDVTVDTHFVEELVRAVEQDASIGFAAPRLLRFDDDTLLDSAGLFLDRRRRPYDRFQMKRNNETASQPVDVFGACGAAALYTRRFIEDLSSNGEFLDEDFFAYYEDVDISWRAQRRGWRCVYVPEAIGRHVRGWGDTLRKGGRQKTIGPRLALRNRYLMILKNDGWKSFLSDLPSIFLAELPRLLLMMLVRPSALAGIIDAARMAPLMMRKRFRTAGQNTVSAEEVRKKWLLLKKG